MHRKKVRRWHKLLSVSGILVAALGALIVPMANAQVGGPEPTGIYGPTYTNQDWQMQYLDFERDVVDLTTGDLYITGTATGCQMSELPGLVGFSFGLRVTGCSDGTYRLNLKANSIAYKDNGATGPVQDYVGQQTKIDRTSLSIGFGTPLTSPGSHQIDWPVLINHDFMERTPWNFTVNGNGCILENVFVDSFGLLVRINNCAFGTNVWLTLEQNSITDWYGGTGPSVALTSPPLGVTVAPAVSPTASPTATSTPTPTPTPSDAPASVTVVSDPPPPPAPPEPPTATEPAPLAAPVSDAAPTAPEPEPVLEVPVVSLEPIAAVRSEIVEVRKGLVVPQPIEPVAEAIPESPAPVVQKIAPIVESTPTPSFNWQPIGYLAIGLGGVAAVVGGYLLIQRMMRVRRFRFS